MSNGSTSAPEAFAGEQGKERKAAQEADTQRTFENVGGSVFMLADRLSSGTEMSDVDGMFSPQMTGALQ